MKKNNVVRTLNTKKIQQTIPKSIINKLLLLIGFIIPVALFISYSMNVNFFSITKIISIFVLIISIAAYLKDEVMYPRFKVIHHGNTVGIKKNTANKKHNTKFSFSLNKGTVQVVLSMIIIIICTYLGQVIYKQIG